MVQIGDIQLGTFPLLLAPMKDVRDPPFRALCKEKGADLLYTEFIAAEGLIRDAAKSVQKLDIYNYEQPIGIRIYGEKIASMREEAAIAEASRPALIDINYSYPVKKIACRGAGAGILLDLPRDQALYQNRYYACTTQFTGTYRRHQKTPAACVTVGGRKNRLVGNEKLLRQILQRGRKHKAFSDTASHNAHT